MKRLISGMEAVQAGLATGAPWHLLDNCGRRGPPTTLLAAVETTPACDAFRLWRSLPGYRKACRMLRRGGRRIRRGEAISSAYYHGLDLARGPDCSAVVVWGEPVLEIHDSHLKQ